MNLLPALLALLAALGGAAVVLGEADDSPGLQLLGVVLVAVTAVLLVRRERRPV